MKRTSKSSFTFIDLFVGCGELTVCLLQSGRHEAMTYEKKKISIV